MKINKNKVYAKKVTWEKEPDTIGIYLGGLPIFIGTIGVIIWSVLIDYGGYESTRNIVFLGGIILGGMLIIGFWFLHSVLGKGKKEYFVEV